MASLDSFSIAILLGAVLVMAGILSSLLALRFGAPLLLVFLAIGMLAIAGSLAAKKHIPPSAGTLPTHTPLFVTLLAITVIVVGALTFLPALALGPIAEQLAMSGK